MGTTMVCLSPNELSSVGREVLDNKRLWTAGMHKIPLGRLLRLEGSEHVRAPVYLRDGVAALEFLQKADVEPMLKSVNGHGSVADIVMCAYSNGWYDMVVDISEASHALFLPVGLLYSGYGSVFDAVEFNDLRVLEATELLSSLKSPLVAECQAQILCDLWSLGNSANFSFKLPQYVPHN